MSKLRLAVYLNTFLSKSVTIHLIQELESSYRVLIKSGDIVKKMKKSHFQKELQYINIHSLFLLIKETEVDSILEFSYDYYFLYY